mmetsp:Transcript_13484/g.31715  ORF Transcript_13484/g.31715 Transcript_13484/m.31715 type:complete len:254 (-) Transcript_13484:53-814(-)
MSTPRLMDRGFKWLLHDLKLRPIASASAICSLLAMGFLAVDPQRLYTLWRKYLRQRMQLLGLLSVKAAPPRPPIVKFLGTSFRKITHVQELEQDVKAACWWQPDELASFLATFVEVGTDFEDNDAGEPSSPASPTSPGRCKRSRKGSSEPSDSSTKGLATPSTVRSSSNRDRIKARDSYRNRVIKELDSHWSVLDPEAWDAIARVAKEASSENCLQSIARAQKARARLVRSALRDEEVMGSAITNCVNEQAAS